VINAADMKTVQALKGRIRQVPDFPKAGILFYDITTLLRDPAGFKLVVDSLAAPFLEKSVQLVVGIESRGFILGAAVADRLGAGFAPIRKPGKLPAATLKETFQLEYGSDTLELHQDAIERGQRVLIVDDVLATGGTAAAAASLVRRLDGDLVGMAFLIELLFLNGRSKIPGEQVFSILTY
jgi:adenine phosphoribosyltransferase